MAINTRLSRLPLRDVIHEVDHRLREINEHLQMDLAPAVGDLHRLSRPKRKKSAYPAVRSVWNGVDKIRRSFEYAKKQHMEIEECVNAIQAKISDIHNG